MTLPVTAAEFFLTEFVIFSRGHLPVTISFPTLSSSITFFSSSTVFLALSNYSFSKP